MNWDAIGAIAELVGAVGVIATLVYLARQINQNTSTVRSAAAAAHAQANQTLNVMLSQDAADQPQGSEAGTFYWRNLPVPLTQPCDRGCRNAR